MVHACGRLHTHVLTTEGFHFSAFIMTVAGDGWDMSGSDNTGCNLWSYRLLN